MKVNFSILKIILVLSFAILTCLFAFPSPKILASNSDCINTAPNAGYIAVATPNPTNQPNQPNDLYSSQTIPAPGSYIAQNCLIGAQANIPISSDPNFSSYLTSLKNFYTNNKTPNKLEIACPSSGCSQTDLTGKIGTNKSMIFHLTNATSNSDLTIFSNITTPPTPAIPIVVFVDGNLYINQDFDYGNSNSNSGVVFLVQGTINIAPTVTKVSAFMITFGGFCSYYDVNNGSSNHCSFPATGSQPQLTITGSVIDLNSATGPQFIRNSGNDTTPAEKVIYDPKYLVNMRGVFSNDQTTWTEIP